MSKIKPMVGAIAIMLMVGDNAAAWAVATVVTGSSSTVGAAAAALQLGHREKPLGP